MDTIKPLIPEQRICTVCKNDFTAYLKLADATPYKTCEECRLKCRKQGKKHREHIKSVKI